MRKKASGLWLRRLYDTIPRGELQRRTGIPASVLKRAQAGRAALSRNSKLALYNAYRGANYRALRKAGVDAPRARAVCGKVDGRIIDGNIEAAKRGGGRALDNLDKLTRAGFRFDEAAVKSVKAPPQVKTEAQKMDRYARLILANARRIRPGEKITLANIKDGLSKSERFPTSQEVEEYVKPYERGTWAKRTRAELPTPARKGAAYKAARKRMEEMERERESWRKDFWKAHRRKMAEVIHPDEEPEEENEY